MLGGGAELREVLEPEGGLEAGGAVGGDLVDDVLAAGDVVGLVDEQRHAWALGLGQVDLALQLGVQHPEDEQHAGLAVLGADRAHVGVDDQDVAGLDDLPQGDVGGVVEEAPERRDAGQAGDLVARRVQAFGDAAGGHAQVVGQLGAVELGGLVEVGLVGARLGDRASELVLRRPQQAVDVLEPGASSLFGGDRDRADDCVVEVAARGLVDLVLVDVEQRGDDVVGDLRGLDRERPVADQPQRAHPERRAAEVEEPDPLAAVGRGHAQADARQL